MNEPRSPSSGRLPKRRGAVRCSAAGVRRGHTSINDRRQPPDLPVSLLQLVADRIPEVDGHTGSTVPAGPKR